MLAVAISTSGCDPYNHSWQRHTVAPEFPLIPEASCGLPSSPYAEPENITVATWQFYAGLLFLLCSGKSWSPTCRPDCSFVLG